MMSDAHEPLILIARSSEPGGGDPGLSREEARGSQGGEVRRARLVGWRVSSVIPARRLAR